MRVRIPVLVLAVAILLPAACAPSRVSDLGDGDESTSTAPRSVPTPTLTPDPTPSETPAILVGAGDISSCENDNDELTARILDGIEGTVFAAGDLAYESGSAEQFSLCYDPTWGRHRSRTLPVVGNHEYGSPTASAYFTYFGDAAGEPGAGWYATRVGEWRVIVLDSNCFGPGGSCEAGSTQEQWLRATLAADRETKCTLAIMHHARFSSGAKHGSATEVEPLWSALYDNDVDLVVSGHEHLYERFAPQTPQGALDLARGIREIVVGTGGRSLYEFATPLPNSEARDNTSFGVLKLELWSDRYAWSFIGVPGSTFIDEGTGICH